MSHSHSNARHALVIDQSKHERDNSKRILTKLGFIVEESDGSGQQVLQIIKEAVLKNHHHGGFDCMVVSHETKDVNGPQTVHRIRNPGFKGLVVGLVHYDNHDGDSQFQESGANFVLSLPLTAENIHHVFMDGTMK